MTIEIKKLTPELTEDYLHFFDITPHDDDTPGSKCYCVCWCSADHNLPTDFSSQGGRRELAKDYIGSGIIQGYLAYNQNKVVGWCNANTKNNCVKCISWMRFMKNIDIDKNAKIKSVFCFVIAPEMQRKGVATKLLEHVCEDAKKDGFEIVESYPKKDFVSVARDFMGPASMYTKLGFDIYQELNGNEIVMRKKLNNLSRRL